MASLFTVPHLPDWARFPGPDAEIPPKLYAAILTMARAIAEQAEQDFPQRQTYQQLLKKLRSDLFNVALTTPHAMAVRNLANAFVLHNLEAHLTQRHSASRLDYLRYVESCCPLPAVPRVLRRLARDPDPPTRKYVLERLDISTYQTETIISSEKGNSAGGTWQLPPDKLLARSAQLKPNLPVIPTIGALRQLLQIPTQKRLGFYLLACPKLGEEKDAAGKVLQIIQNGPYRLHEIPKRNGKMRQIQAPGPGLKAAQRLILRTILDQLPVHPAAHGFVVGRSITSNAQPHVGQALLLKFDLQDFFPTIHYRRVLGLFSSLGYPCGDFIWHTQDDSTSVAPILARLCCYAEQAKVWGGGFTPQGAPTSPAIANYLCRRLDQRLTGLATKCQGVYTRYADDLTFSFSQEALLTLKIGRFRWWVDQICQQEGFFVNEEKFRAIRKGKRQSVTGLVVNAIAQPNREARRLFRAQLHELKTKGLTVASRGDSKFASYLKGMVAHLNAVRPERWGQDLAEVTRLLKNPQPGEA